MKEMKWLGVSAFAGVLAAGTAQGAVVNDLLTDLVVSNGLVGTPVKFDFNDLSLSTNLSGTTVPSTGDVIEGVFVIDSITLTTVGGSFIDEVDLSSTDVEVFGRFSLTIGSVGAVITTSAASFQIYEDDRADGLRSVAGLTGSVAYNSATWGGGAGLGSSVQGGSQYADLDILSGGSYTLVPLPNGDLSILPDLNIAAAGLPINDPALGVSGNVTGTGTVSPTNVPGEFTDRASFTFGAVIPEPASAALLGLGCLVAAKRRIG